MGLSLSLEGVCPQAATAELRDALGSHANTQLPQRTRSETDLPFLEDVIIRGQDLEIVGR